MKLPSNKEIFNDKVLINEALFQFIWQFQYFNRSQLYTSAGEPIQIIHPGIFNKNQGPDFLNAKIKVGETVLVGSVELHINSSEWFKHNHHKDEKYNNVILHVVFKNDKELQHIPVLELQPHISIFLLEQYSNFMNSQTFNPCGTSISEVKEILWTSWKERLLVERLTRKSNYILQLLNQNNLHWEETLWWLLARNLGMKVNGEAFEAMARSIPVTVLAKHKHQIQQLEALLFGQCNLLEGTFTDEYAALLQREYFYLKKKLNLKPTHQQILFLRMRPQNFPTVRLAQLAVLIQNSTHLFSKILEIKELSEVRNLFDVTANDYWHYHYVFDQETAFKEKKLGDDTINNILINTICPLIFTYGIYHGDDRYKQKALEWYQQIPAEKNVITKGFESLKINNENAFDSQALIELKNEYCNNKKCLECSLGAAILKI